MELNVCLIGAGPMAVDYAKVLQAQNVKFEVVGRGKKSAELFEQQTGIKVNYLGGLDSALKAMNAMPDVAIVAVSVEQLFDTSVKLLHAGVKKLLIEKPAGINYQQIKTLNSIVSESAAEAYVAYNRRFYSSVIAVKEMILDDGGITSFNFEITEWGHVLKGIEKPSLVKENWFFANTSHVVDLAFHVAGAPKEMSSFVAGSLDWHPKGSRFSGAGKVANDALFSYFGDWSAPGRWGVEFLTKKRKFVLKPLEKLEVQKLGSIKPEPFPLDDKLDSEYKPGLFRQVDAFLSGDIENLCSIVEQLSMAKVYTQMTGDSFLD